MFEIASVMVMLFLARGGGGQGVTFFSGDNSVFFGGEGYILKLAFSHDKVLSCILQNALNCSLK